MSCIESFRFFTLCVYKLEETLAAQAASKLNSNSSIRLANSNRDLVSADGKQSNLRYIMDIHSDAFAKDQLNVSPFLLTNAQPVLEIVC